MVVRISTVVVEVDGRDYDVLKVLLIITDYVW